MPIYQCQCPCGLRFDKAVPFSQKDAALACPDCGKSAERLMPTTVAGVFIQNVTSPGPQNTGIHSLDVHVDRVIGQSSAQGWEAHEERDKDKKEALRNNHGADPHALTRRPDGTWRPLTEKERGVQVRALSINEARMPARSVDNQRAGGRASLKDRRRPRSR